MLTQEFQKALEHQQAGELVEAEGIYRRIMVNYPDIPEAHYNLGAVLKSARRPREAIEAFERAVALRPEFAEAHNNLGNALREMQQPAMAVAAYRRALAVRENFAEAWNNLGAALKDVGELDEALDCFQRAIALQPENAAAHSNRLCTLYFHPGYDPAAIAREHELWNRRHALPLKGEISRHDNEPSARRRLRVGYVSPYFRRHCQALFLTPLLSAHDHQNFEIFCYGDISVPDAVTERLRSLADVWRNTSRLGDGALAQLIRQDKIDILVDLTLHMAANRMLVFARKPAPVQLSWLGYPGTTGLDAMDYRLTDPFLDPPGESDGHYRETSIRLPETFWCYDPGELDESEPDIGPLPALRVGHVTFGSLNNFCKVSDRTLGLWANVMAAVAGSRLVMLCPPGEHRQRVMGIFQERGVAVDRVEFVEFQPREKYLQTYRAIDLGLDTLPYNGHTTSLDSLWMGVPVITLIGQTAVGRAGWSQLSNLGLEEFAAADEKQFMEVARRWAGDLHGLAELRSALRQRMRRSPLMDGGRFARHIEAVYRTVWQHWRQKQAAAI